MKEPAEPAPAADAEQEHKKGGLLSFFRRQRERIYLLFGKGDFKESLRRTMQAPAALAMKDLPQWKPRGLITLSGLLGDLWRRRIPFVIAAVLFICISMKVAPTRFASNFFKLLPGSATWETASSASGQIWNKHSPQTITVPGSLAAGLGSPGSADPASNRKNAATEISRTLIALFSGGGPISAAFLGDGTQAFASDGSPAFAGDNLKGDKKWNSIAAAAVGAALAPRRDRGQPPLPVKSQAGEELAAAMRDGNADLEKKLGDYAKNETWTLQKAGNHEETLPPLDGDAIQNSSSMQVLLKTRVYTQVALHCGNDCRIEKRMYNNRATFYGEKN